MWATAVAQAARGLSLTVSTLQLKRHVKWDLSEYISQGHVLFIEAANAIVLQHVTHMQFRQYWLQW